MFFEQLVKKSTSFYHMSVCNARTVQYCFTNSVRPMCKDMNTITFFDGLVGASFWFSEIHHRYKSNGTRGSGMIGNFCQISPPLCI